MGCTLKLTHFCRAHGWSQAEETSRPGGGEAHQRSGCLGRGGIRSSDDFGRGVMRRGCELGDISWDDSHYEAPMATGALQWLWDPIDDSEISGSLGENDSPDPVFHSVSQVPLRPRRTTDMFTRNPSKLA